MPAIALDHINLSSSDLERTRRFYTEVLGFVDGPRPPFRRAGAWMYLGGQALIHISTGRAPATRSSDAFDHVAFRWQGLADMRRLLTQRGLYFEEYAVPEQNMHQLFFRDPDGTEIELIFDAAEMPDHPGPRDATQGRKT